MLIDILILAYILLLMPLIYECEKLETGGLKILLIGLFLTPIVGYIFLFYKKKSKPIFSK